MSFFTGVTRFVSIVGLSMFCASAFSGISHEKCTLNPLGKNISGQCQRIFKRIGYDDQISSSADIAKMDFDQKGCVKIHDQLASTDYCGFTINATHVNLRKFLMNNLSVSFGKNRYGGVSCAAPSVINNSTVANNNGERSYHVVCSKSYADLPLGAIDSIGTKNHLFHNTSFLNTSEVAEMFKYGDNLFRGYVEEKMGNKFIIAQVCSSYNSCSGAISQPAVLRLSPIVLNSSGTPKKSDGLDVYYTGLLPISYIQKSVRSFNGKDFIYLKDDSEKGHKISYISRQNKTNYWLSNPSIHIINDVNRYAHFKFLSRSGKWVYVTPGVSFKHLSLQDIKAPKTEKTTITVLTTLPNLKNQDYMGLHALKIWMLKIHPGYDTICGVVTASNGITITLLDKKMRNVNYPSALLFDMQESGKCSFRKAAKYKKEQSVIFTASR